MRTYTVKRNEVDTLTISADGFYVDTSNPGSVFFYTGSQSSAVQIAYVANVSYITSVPA